MLEEEEGIFGRGLSTPVHRVAGGGICRRQRAEVRGDHCTERSSQ